MRTKIIHKASFEKHRGHEYWVLKFGHGRWTRDKLSMECTGEPFTNFWFLYIDNPTFLLDYL